MKRKPTSSPSSTRRKPAPSSSVSAAVDPDSSSDGDASSDDRAAGDLGEAVRSLRQRQAADVGDDEDEALDEVLGRADADDGRPPAGSSSASEGEDLFDEDVERADYAAREELDRYSSEDIDDDGEYDGLDALTRRRAEAALSRRDRARSADASAALHAGYSLPAAMRDDADDGLDDDELDDADADADAHGDERGAAASLGPASLAGGGSLLQLRRRRRMRQLATELPSGGSGSARASTSAAGAAAAGGAGGGAAAGPFAAALRGTFVDGVDLDEPVNLEGLDDARHEAIRLEHVRRYIAARVNEFFRTVCAEAIFAMCTANRECLEVAYIDLSRFERAIALWVAKLPVDMLHIMDHELMLVVLLFFPNYRNIKSHVHVRLTELPVHDKLRELRQAHLNMLVRVSGVVTRRTSVFPQLIEVRYDCGPCGRTIGPFSVVDADEVRLGKCPYCQRQGPFFVNPRETLYRNFQKITLQESPGSVPAGRIPRSKEVILTDDLIDSVRPGEEVDVTGVFLQLYDAGLNTQQGFPVFSTVIEANYVAKVDESLGTLRISEDDERRIRELARDPNIGRRIIRSIAPSIYGHRNIKTALALCLFGGVHKEIEKKHRLRGDINVLLLGDPGTAKSQFLKYVQKTSHRAVYATGQGASAVGLTAAVRRDPVAGEWVLEGGALVLADKGVCLIDEFEKMNDRDRTSIHEAMEQQSISISKAGIVTTLQARCSIIAAANPIGSGRYRPSLSFAQNVELTEPILSRFDVLCVVQDVVDPIEDERLANFVVRSHRHSAVVPGAESTEPYADTAASTGDDVAPIPQELLRKYIMYARRRCSPQLVDIERDKISRLYSEMRHESMAGGGLPMTVRHVESLLRLSEAHARMHLREFVTAVDVNVAIRVVLESFISSQKNALALSLRKRFRSYLTFQRDFDELLLNILHSMVRELSIIAAARRQQAPAPGALELDMDAFEARASQLSIPGPSQFYSSQLFQRMGFHADAQARVIRHGRRGIKVAGTVP